MRYEHRNMLRANEEAAIAQAISILNSDEAFATFDEAGVQTFVQLDSKDSVRSRVAQSAGTLRSQGFAILQHGFGSVLLKGGQCVGECPRYT